MKKLLLLATFGVLVLFSNAQDFKKVLTPFVMKQLEVAKVEIDKIVADPKAANNPLTWIWKSKVYAALYKDDATRLKYPGSEIVADEAFKKYISIDPTYKSLKEIGAQDAPFDIYSASFNLGIKAFNAKNWDSSFYYFNYAVYYSDIIFQNKFTPTNGFDTTAVLYKGFSAQNGKKYDEAVKCYERIADSSVFGDSYADIYKFILVNCSDHKDSATFYKYYTIAKKGYPKTDWEEYELDFIGKSYDLAQKTRLFEKEDAAGTLSELRYLHYADMFANPTKAEKANMDSLTLAAYQIKASDAFKKAFAKNSENSIAAFNAGVIYYNNFNIYDDRQRVNIKTLQELNANKPVEKDPKKKVVADAKFKEQIETLKKANAEIDKPMTEAADISIEWLEKAFNILKDKTQKAQTEKNCYNKSVDFLANLYAYKRDKARGKDPKNYDAFDAKYKYYDGLHSN